MDQSADLMTPSPALRTPSVAGKKKSPPWPFETGPFYRRNQVGAAGNARLPVNKRPGVDCMYRFNAPVDFVRSKDVVSYHEPGREIV